MSICVSWQVQVAVLVAEGGVGGREVASAMCVVGVGNGHYHRAHHVLALHAGTHHSAGHRRA